MAIDQYSEELIESTLLTKLENSFKAELSRGGRLSDLACSWLLIFWTTKDVKVVNVKYSFQFY